MPAPIPMLTIRVSHTTHIGELFGYTAANMIIMMKDATDTSPARNIVALNIRPPNIIRNMPVSIIVTPNR